MPDFGYSTHTVLDDALWRLNLLYITRTQWCNVDFVRRHRSLHINILCYWINGWTKCCNALNSVVTFPGWKCHTQKCCSFLNNSLNLIDYHYGVNAKNEMSHNKCVSVDTKHLNINGKRTISHFRLFGVLNTAKSCRPSFDSQSFCLVCEAHCLHK